MSETDQNKLPPEYADQVSKLKIKGRKGSKRQWRKQKDLINKSIQLQLDDQQEISPSHSSRSHNDNAPSRKDVRKKTNEVFNSNKQKRIQKSKEREVYKKQRQKHVPVVILSSISRECNEGHDRAHTLNAALNRVKRVNGEIRVYGKWCLSSKIVIERFRNLTIQGMTPDAEIISERGGILVTHCYNVCFERLYLMSRWFSCINLEKCRFVSISNCILQSPTTGLLFQHTTNVQIENNRFLGCAHAITMERGTAMVFIGWNTFVGNTSAVAGDFLDAITFLSYNTVYNGSILDATHSSQIPEDSIVSWNTLKENNTTHLENEYNVRTEEWVHCLTQQWEKVN